MFANITQYYYPPTGNRNRIVNVVTLVNKKICCCENVNVVSGGQACIECCTLTHDRTNRFWSDV